MLLDNDPIVSSNSFKSVYSLKSLMGVQMSLKFNMSEASAGVHKDAAAFVRISIVASSVGG